MTCDCKGAKHGFLVLNRMEYADEVAVLCLKCGKLWRLKDERR